MATTTRTSLADFLNRGSLTHNADLLETQGSIKQGAAILPSSKCVGFWRLNETSGTSAADSSMWVRGRFGLALNFNGNVTSSNNKVDCGSGSTIDNIWASGGTFEAWIYVRSDGENDNGRIVDKEQAGANGWFLMTEGEVTGKVKLGFRVDWSGAQANWRTTNTEVKLNTWTHVAVTYNSSSTTNDPIIYVDGASVGITEVTSPSGTVNSEAANNLVIGNRNGTSNVAFDGAICDVRIWTVVRTSGEISTNKDTTLTGSETNLKAYYKMLDGTGTTVTDSTSNANTGTFSGQNTGTINGTPTFNRTGIRNRGSSIMDFDNSNNYVQSASPSITSADQDFTVQAWVYLDNPTDADGNQVWNTRNTGSGNPIISAFVNGTTPKLVFQFRNDGGTTSTHTGNTQLSASTWYHCMWVRDNANSKVKMYVNGILDYDATQSSVGTLSGINRETIGINAFSLTDAPLDGVLQNVIVAKRVITPFDPEFDGPTPKPIDRGVTANTVGYWKLQESSGSTSAVDSATGGTNLAENGSVTEGKVGVLDKCYSFNETVTNYYASSGDVNAIEFGSTSDFTIEAWVRTNKTSYPSENYFLGKLNSGATTGYWFGINSSYGLGFNMVNGSTYNVTSGSGGKVLLDNQWHHVAVTRTSSGTVLKLYVDGVQIASSTITAVNPDNANKFAIGRAGEYAGASTAWNGEISHVRISNTALTPNLFNVERSTNFVSDWIDNGSATTTYKITWTEDISATGTDVEAQIRTCDINPVDSNTVLLWNFEDNLEDSSPNKMSLTINGAPYFTTGKSGRGIWFDGVDDYLSSTNAQPASIANNITLEAWVKPDSPNDQMIVGLKRNGSTDYHWALAISATGKALFVAYDGTNNPVVTGTTTLVAGTWYHLMGTYDGANMKLYVNTTQEGGNVASTMDFTTTDYTWVIGRNPGGSNRYFPGTVDSVRLSNVVRTTAQSLYNLSDWYTRRSTTTGTNETTSSHQYVQAKIHLISNNT